MRTTRGGEASNDIFDPFDENLISSPYPTYHLLRSAEPVHWCAPLQCWVLTRMEDIQTVLNDGDFVPDDRTAVVADVARRAGRNYDPLITILGEALLFKNGERHRHDRRTIATIMNGKPFRQLEPVIEELAMSLSSKLARLSEYDAIQQFADPLPQLVMAHILDLPLSDVPVLSELLAELTLIFDLSPLHVYDNVNRKVATALDLVKTRMDAANRNSPGSALSITYDATSGSREDRLNSAAALILFVYRVGAETTIGFLGFLIRTLMRKPALRHMLIEDPTLAPTVVSEVLRLEGNVQRSVRIGRTTRVIGGKTIEAGQPIMLLLGAANRDPEAFAEPDSLSLNVRNTPDVVFGAGHHFCLGASLARLEGRISLKQFLDLPPIEQAGEEMWYQSRTIRRLTRLPVRVTKPTAMEM